ncbi:response regulator transcription factor (plasmid) [Paroceanicella profunda]|uniref:Response regulator transcription factor n=1 Tax=Paroceanicella profunda TaxID=2579971 RepID=A0A5B8G5J6_9RHOB|nr:response regulator transcription factor [Paroceanicella profunda]
MPILVAEDDEDIASALQRGLGRAGFEVVVAHDAAAALRLGRARGFSAAVIDVMLGDEDGRDLVRALRRAGMTAPIVMLSALSGVDDRAEGLEAGADDYVAKPFDLADLAARIRVQARRRAGGEPRGPALRYDPERRLASGPTRTVQLTDREGLLLSLLMDQRGRILSRGEIFDTLWADTGGSSENVVDVYIGYLRRKLAPMSDFGLDLRTVRGRGFVLMETSE